MARMRPQTLLNWIDVHNRETPVGILSTTVSLGRTVTLLYSTIIKMGWNKIKVFNKNLSQKNSNGTTYLVYNNFILIMMYQLVSRSIAEFWSEIFNL